MPRIATYGTLKRGFYNNYLLGPDAKFVGEGSFQGRIWIEKGQGYPRASTEPINGEVGDVWVEVYDIDDFCFDVIDRLERAFAYEAFEVVVRVEDTDNITCLCWLSRLPIGTIEILEDGIYA